MRGKQNGEPVINDGQSHNRFWSSSCSTSRLNGPKSSSERGKRWTKDDNDTVGEPKQQMRKDQKTEEGIGRIEEIPNRKNL